MRVRRSLAMGLLAAGIAVPAGSAAAVAFVTPGSAPAGAQPGAPSPAEDAAPVTASKTIKPGRPVRHALPRKVVSSVSGTVVAVDVVGRTLTVAVKGGRQNARPPAVIITVPADINLRVGEEIALLADIRVMSRVTVTGYRSGAGFIAWKIRARPPEPAAEPTATPTISPEPTASPEPTVTATPPS